MARTFWLLTIFPTGTLITQANRSLPLKAICNRQGESSNVSASSIFAVAIVIFPMVIIVLAGGSAGASRYSSLKVINDLGKQALYQLQLEDLSPALARAFKSRDNRDNEITLLSYFGTTAIRLFMSWQGYCLNVFPVRFWKWH